MPGGAVHVEGLAQFRAALRRIDPQLAKGVREGLKDGAQIVANEARQRAPVRTGSLVASVRAFASGNRAGVRVNARRPSRKYPAGYPYPRRIEFEGGGARAFVRPALAARADDVRRRIGYVIDDIGETWEG